MLFWLACAINENPVDNFAALGETDLCDDLPSGSVDFPTDFSPHNTTYERWRWSASLMDGEGSSWFFQVTATWISEAIWEVSTSLANPETGEFLSSIDYISGAEPGGAGVDFLVGGVEVVGGLGSDAISVDTENWSIALSFTEEKTPMLASASGEVLFEQGSGYLYSWPRMQVSGELFTGSATGGVMSVVGMGEAEHLWGNMQDVVGSGWARLNVQLQDGRDLSLVYVAGQSTPLASATISNRYCQVSDASTQITMTPASNWTSTMSACTWPISWELELDGEKITVDPAQNNQEFANADTRFWSGEVNVGSVGRGSLEVTGCFPGQ
jgi:predicted secreted hydrolase